MELQTISQVSKEYGISTRMLRYYEQIGLIKSVRRADYSYRVYDELALKRLQHIILLRKMQIPVKQITTILTKKDAAVTIDIFKNNMLELDKEISALSTIRSILGRFINELEKIAAVQLKLDLLNDASVMKLADSLSLVQRNVKENLSMNDLSKADRQLSKLQDVRIVYLPPMTVASSHYAGENPEYNAGKFLNEFVIRSGLFKTKPDLRYIGFDNPTNPYGDSNGYEMWVSILDDMDVPVPLVKKKFLGGLYAAHATEMSNIDHWLALQEWVNDSDKYQSDAYAIRCKPPIVDFNGYMEEQLNYFSNIQEHAFDGSAMQMDLLLPVKALEPTEIIPVEITRSKDICGFKAKLIAMKKFKIMGFSKFISLDIKSEELKTEATQDFWREITTDGRLDTLLKHKKPGAPILMFGSFDHESQRNNSWRQTICLMASDITDENSLKTYDPFIKKIDASNWISFEIAKATTELNPHAAAPKLGFTFNGPIGGIFTVYPEGNTGILDSSSKYDMESVIHCWFPVK